MAITLTLVGSATVDFLGSGYGLLEDFQPKQPNLDGATLLRALSGDPALERSLTIVESFRVRITGANVAALKTNINAIERLLFVEAGRRRATQQGQRVFLTYKPSGGATTYRSEVVGGRVEFLQRSLAVWQWDALDTEIRVYIERKYFWEENSETTLPLTNANGSSTTSAIAVYNHNDAGATDDNFVQIAAADAAGVLPCPFRIEIINTYGTALRRVYIAHKASGTPASFTHILEAESATLNATYVTAGADAACSNGNKAAIVNVPASVATLFTWTLSTTQAGYIKNQWIRPILRFSVLPNNATCSARFTIKDSTTGAILYQTDYQLLSNADYLQALPEFFLSQNLQGQATSGAIDILLDMKDSAATCDMTLDFVQLSPIEAGNGFRFLKPIDESLVTIAATTGKINDNMIDDGLYIESRQGIYQALGGPILCVPNALQLLYFLCDGASDAAIARTITVNLYIRPRFLTT